MKHASIWVTVALFLPVMLFAQDPGRERSLDQPRMAGQGLKSRGVETYSVLQGVDEATIRLFDGGGHENATMVVTERGGRIEIRYTSTASNALVISWAPALGEMTLREPGGTVFTSRRAGPPTFELMDETPGMAAAMKQWEPELTNALQTMAELEERGVQVVRSPSQIIASARAGDRALRSDGMQTNIADCKESGCDPIPVPDPGPTAPPSTPPGTGGSGPFCGGITVVGEAWGSWSRSRGCLYARNDANLKCWNTQCIGCCKLLECDAWCQRGDFICYYTSMMGQACGR